MEDVQVNRELMTLLLEGRGYQVESVADGLEAIEAVITRPFDIVFMDMQMPRMDGLEATRAIRALGGRHLALPIVGLSANVIGEHVKRCLDAGMSDHLPKPFSEQSLATAVERWSGRNGGAQREVLDNFTQQVGWASMVALLDMLRAQIDLFQTCPLDAPAVLQKQAHALRGSAAALGFLDLAEICRVIDRACERGDAVTSLSSAKQRACELALRAIKNEIARGA